MPEPQPLSSLVAFLNANRFAVEPTGIVPLPPIDDPQQETLGQIPAGATPGLGEEPPFAMAASVQRSANKSSLNKNKRVLNKNKNKNKNKASNDGGKGYDAGLIPAAALRRLHSASPRAPFDALARFTWEALDLPPPPGPDVARLETAVLLAMQARDDERRRRLSDIERESSMSVAEFTRPLGIEGLAGFEATEGLFLNILTACEYVGLLYKARFNRLRPNQLEPRLRLLLPNPAHEAYPSNHAFQCFSIAFGFNAILPEHPATETLSLIARNVAENREWAGLHYPSDTIAGRELARRFLPYLANAFLPEFLAAQREWL